MSLVSCQMLIDFAKGLPFTIREDFGIHMLGSGVRAIWYRRSPPSYRDY